MSFKQYLKLVICFIILTDLTKFLLKFCVDEVFEERGVTDVRRIKRGKSSSLGMPKAPQVNILRILKHLSLGLPRLAPHLSSSTIIGIPRFLFCSHNLCPLCFCFSCKNHDSMGQPFLDLQNTSCASLISFKYDLIELLFVLHLNLLSMVLQNASCTSLIYFELGYWLDYINCRMLHALRLYRLEYE